MSDGENMHRGHAHKNSSYSPERVLGEGEGAMQVRKYIEDVDLTSNFNGGRPGGSLERGALLKVRLEREVPMKI